MRVIIDANGRRVEIETVDANVSPKDIGDQALKLWQATDGPRGTEGPAGYGFTQERKQWQVSPMNMSGYGNGLHPGTQGGG